MLRALQPFEDIRLLVRDRGSNVARSCHVVFQGHWRYHRAYRCRCP